MDQLFRIFDKDGDGSIDFKVHHHLSHHHLNHHHHHHLNHHHHHHLNHHHHHRLNDFHHHDDYQGVHDCDGYEQLRGSCRETEVNWKTGSLLWIGSEYHHDQILFWIGSDRNITITMIRWAFRMYDKDNSGEIDLDEMVEIFCLMYSIQVSLSSPSS